MPESLTELEERARRLSTEDRARLALALIESLEPADTGNIEEAWLAEAQRRSAQLDRGEVKTIPAAETFAEVRRSLK
jgi:putative addiction module component (TIGR02574 family)